MYSIKDFVLRNWLSDSDAYLYGKECVREVRTWRRGRSFTQLVGTKMETIMENSKEVHLKTKTKTTV